MLPIRLIVATVVSASLLGCGQGPKSQPEPDYIVPKKIDVVQICQYVRTSIRSYDSDCTNAQADYQWVYIQRGGHNELPAVGERIYRNEASPDRPSGLEIGRIPDRGAWWNTLGP